ncbi:hypothetical protein [Bradyrhizobium sp. 6(2017)]|uniref:hypothetical protein n=1 Tax=Bradyrhizobium sp. 6(2017) TaxID=1197460 RepID=UPI0013E18614|nr:hypothetical protein [Bradyrhizobium sp. 6(2017)]QIG92286.1 hypothetical protein G6P99_07065 [Bradyrhizobium sp. 6(2017)]
MTLNLESDITEQVRALDPAKWSTLQTEICLNIAHAEVYAFTVEAEHVAQLVRLGFLDRAAAADHLHTAAIYNRLYLEYGTEAIQKIMADAIAGALAGAA